MHEPRSEPRLVCPRCRRVDDGRLSIAFLDSGDRHLQCSRCQSLYPLVDETRVVVKDMDAWTAATKDDEALVRIFRRRDVGPLADRVDEIVNDLSGDILDLGCGCGALYRRRDVTAIDWSLAMAREFGSGALVADAADPPFEPARFDAVLLLNVLDASPNPRLVLAQADTLLRPGGTLVVSCPYAWNERVPSERRFSAEELVEALGGDGEALGVRSRYDITTLEDPVTWRLRLSNRLVQEYACQLLVATRAAA